MYFAQASTLPPLSNDDSASFLTACCSPSPQSPYRGDEPNTAPSHRLFEAKSLSLHSRPKTSLGMSRSARGFPPSLSTSSLSAWQAAPRHDQDMSNVSTKGRGTGGYDVAQRSFRASKTARRPATRASSSEMLSRESATSPTFFDQDDNGSIWANGSRTRGERNCGDQDGAQTVRCIRRSNSENFSVTSSTGAPSSVADSTDPQILQGEIRRLQAKLMNGFKGGNRFVGGAQFKASVQKRSSSCGGCLQIREALRRSRVEGRDLRGSLFKAEAVIKQLTLTKSNGRTGHKAVDMTARSETTSTLTTGGKKEWKAPSSVDDSSRPASSDSTTSDGRAENLRGKIPPTILSSPPEKLLIRARQLEHELRLAQFRHSHEFGDAVEAEHLLRGALTEVKNLKTSKNLLPGKRRGQDTQDQLFCKKCPELEERLLAEASKVNGLMRQVREHQQKLKRQQEDLTDVESAKVKAASMETRVNVLSQQVEQGTREKDRVEAERKTSSEEIERLVGEMDHWRAQALENQEQAQRLADEHGASRSEASAATLRLEQTQTEFALSRKDSEATIGRFRKKLAENKNGIQDMKEEVEVAREARRRFESQAATTELAHRRALKAALDSCVRLCVVTPTVNINLDHRSHTFCSGLPEEKIRSFVEGSVLPRFTRVLLQPGADRLVAANRGNMVTPVSGCEYGTVGEDHDEAAGSDYSDGRRNGCSVDGQADFDKWLRDLLVDMQTSIERHVASVFQTQTAVCTLAGRR